MKVFPRAPELAFGNHKNIKGRHWFHSVPPESLVGSAGLRRAKPSADTLEHWAVALVLEDDAEADPRPVESHAASAVPFCGYHGRALARIQAFPHSCIGGWNRRAGIMFVRTPEQP